MKAKFYRANSSKAILQVTTVLGQDSITIGVADKELNWQSIILDEEASKAFKQFMKDHP